MQKIITYTLIFIFIFLKSTFAVESGELLLKEVLQKYQKLDNFSCTGNIQITTFINNFDYPIHKYSTSFTIKLQKPDKFLIHWESSVPERHALLMAGAIWSAGNNFYYYQKEFGAYFSFSQPEPVFSLTAGISKGISYKIPSIFFSTFFKNNWLSSFKHPSIVKSQGNTLKIIGVDITTKYIEKNEFEIIKDVNLIKNFFSRSTKVVSNNKKAEALKNRKIEIEKNSKKYEDLFTGIIDSNESETIESLLSDFDKRIKSYTKLPENKHIEHVEIKERYEDISITPLNSEDFIFLIPAGVVFKGDSMEHLLENTN